MRYLSMLSCAFSCRANPATNRDIGGLNSQAMNKAARPLGVTLGCWSPGTSLGHHSGTRHSTRVSVIRAGREGGLSAMSMRNRAVLRRGKLP